MIETKHSEAQIERYLLNEIRKLKGLAYKFTSPGHAGVPDRVVLLPNGTTIFVELKKETGKLSALQIETIKSLQNNNIEVYVLYSKEDVDDFIKFVKIRLSKSQPKLNANQTIRLGNRVKLENGTTGRVIAIDNQAVVEIDMLYFNPNKTNHERVVISEAHKLKKL
jgi:hypothetical protein